GTEVSRGGGGKASQQDQKQGQKQDQQTGGWQGGVAKRGVRYVEGREKKSTNEGVKPNGYAEGNGTQKASEGEAEQGKAPDRRNSTKQQEPHAGAVTRA
uniref:hypothetical protein n=1 Tax=Pseudonocardia sp. ICBG601 TaxID=2846759 RepID=UPI001CF715CD